MTGADEVASLSFEQALAELERIVAELESGKTDLEQSIDAELARLVVPFRNVTVPVGEFP